MTKELEEVRERLANIIHWPKGGSHEGYMCAINMSNEAELAITKLDAVISQIQINPIYHVDEDGNVTIAKCQNCGNEVNTIKGNNND